MGQASGHSGVGKAAAARAGRVGDRVGPEGPFGSGHGRALHGASQSATRNGRGECLAINAILAPMKSKRYSIRRGGQAASRRDLRAALAARLIGSHPMPAKVGHLAWGLGWLPAMNAADSLLIAKWQRVNEDDPERRTRSAHGATGWIPERPRHRLTRANTPAAARSLPGPSAAVPRESSLTQAAHFLTEAVDSVRSLPPCRV